MKEELTVSNCKLWDLVGFSVSQEDIDSGEIQGLHLRLRIQQDQPTQEELGKALCTAIKWGSTVTHPLGWPNDDEVREWGFSNGRVIEFLLRNGADINFQNGLPLRTAIKNSNCRMMKFILSNGANFKIKKVESSLKRWFNGVFKDGTANRVTIPNTLDDLFKLKCPCCSWYNWPQKVWG